MSGSHHQAGMDRPIEQRYPKWLPTTLKTAAVLAAIAISLWLIGGDREQALRVDRDGITESTVQMGEFEHYISVRGTAAPLRTVILDSPEGGVVEDIFVENGARVKAADPLLRLSNTQLQLEVIRSDAEVTDQLNNLSRTELDLEKNRLAHQQNLIDLDYEIRRLELEVARNRELVQRGYIALTELELKEEELEYKRERRALTREAQETDLRIQVANMAELRAQTERLRNNLQVAQTKLDNLNVRAPVDGQLTSFEFDVGESLQPGTRIGQISDPDYIKITASLDEFYLPNLIAGQGGVLEHDGKRYELDVRKIYPEVENGQFQIDLGFVGAQPGGIRRGQSLRARLSLSHPELTLKVATGAFTQGTGGTWAFVVSEDGTVARRRSITLGRRNDEFIEVIDGLAAGERIVTSSYLTFLDMERLDLH